MKETPEKADNEAKYACFNNNTPLYRHLKYVGCCKRPDEKQKWFPHLHLDLDGLNAQCQPYQ